ncbi:MAG TPA: hypothetical protein VL576_03375 [Candidatus Paceibacterota bacterium]|jgi:hypothetical protein|nr:hypothetical protein [Candidatus Paceibacterota bacterium]
MGKVLVIAIVLFFVIKEILIRKSNKLAKENLELRSELLLKEAKLELEHEAGEDPFELLLKDLEDKNFTKTQSSDFIQKTHAKILKAIDLTQRLLKIYKKEKNISGIEEETMYLNRLLEIKKNLES